MSEFLERISKLSPQRLTLLADELNERLQAFERGRKVPLAIVGIGCRFPGGVEDPEGFWKLLSEGVDAISEVPGWRWDTAEVYDRNPDTPGKMATRWGGFIDRPDRFDPKFFGIAPGEAVSMDPQQRFLLETSWEALEHAGIAPSSLTGTATGVFVGICSADYSQFALNTPREAITPYLASGLSHAVAAGRISYVLGLQGPSLAVDTSCSASLVAVHLACQSLRLGECNTALAGGVNLILNPDITIALSQSKMMAPDGRCKAFSNSADGFVRAEGCGVIVLKRLPDALRDRNRILAVIRGSACNQDGRSSGLTAPNGPSQEAVITSALADAGLRPDDVDVIEAHGTGTALGDPIEAEALNAVFAGPSRKAEPLLVGSVKTNIGHLESAAGIAGLIKLVLSIQHGKIPASLHLGQSNNRIDWNRLPLRVPKKLQDWGRRREKRTGGISSFGFSGTNAHVIIEEFLTAEPSPSIDDRPRLFALSAKTPTALAAVAARLHHHLADRPLLPLGDIARTLNSGRSHFEYRAAITASSHAELLEGLRQVADDGNSVGNRAGRAEGHSPRVAFVFGGEQMAADAGRELYEQAPVFRESIDRCTEILRKDLGMPLASGIYPVRDGSKQETMPESSEYRRAATFALQYGLAQLWISCGIEPAEVAGWGAGEYVAACVAGVFRLEDGLRFAIAHGETAAGLDELARSVAYHQPQIPLILNSPILNSLDAVDTEAAAACSPEFWSRRHRDGSDSVAVLSALFEQPAAAHLFFGDRSALRQYAKHDESGLPGEWLPALDSIRRDCRQFLTAAASLYVRGCKLDLSAFYREDANTIALPTYPFERERYWLDRGNRAGTTGRGVESARTESGRDESDEWIYDLAWEPKPLSGTMRPSGAALDQDLLAWLAVTPANEALLRIARATDAIMPIYSTYIVQAFQQAGLTPLPQAAFTLEEWSERLRVVPGRRRVLARMLAILVEDKIVERTGNRFHFIDFESRPDADRELERMQSEYPECLTEFKVLRRCGRKFLAVLQGAYDPMQLIFADGSIDETEQMYERSPVCRFFNDKAAKVLRSAVDPIVGRPVRILEIGAGTGATTGPVLEGLEGKNFEYIFTDVSGVFLSRARAKFAHVPSIDYRILNIENDPAAQGFEPGGYDLILAANVLHATADLRRTLAHVRKLLAPGGVLLLIEAVFPDRWLDLTLGLTDGWFRFIDFDLRPEHPLLSTETWAGILREAGMNSCRTISYINDDGSLSQQRVLVAQADVKEKHSAENALNPRREWMVFADGSGIGDAFHKLLVDSGEPCEIVRRPSAAENADSLFQRLEARPRSAELNVVYLWPLDVPETISSLNGLCGAEELCGQTLVHLIQSLLRANPAVQLSVVTRGAQATQHFSPSAGGAVQSLAWGVCRVLAMEAPERYRALVDLAPELSPEAAAAILFAELSTGDGEDQIAYRDGQRCVARLRHSRLGDRVAPESPTIGLRQDASYLLVGGLGGVGLQVARWAADQHPGHLILLSRIGTERNAGPFSEERTNAVQEIRNLGVKVTIIEGDVASQSDMKSLFARFGKEFPPLGGVFHAATVVDGSKLGELADARIEAMLRAKVTGTWVLHEMTKALPLDFFLAFSSTAALLPSKGMAHYAAANQFLDSFAHHRRAAGLPMLSINWGAWDVLRLVSQQDQLSLIESGMLPMAREKVLGLFPDLIASRRAQVMVANIDWEIMKPLFEVSRRRWLLKDLGNGKRVRRALPSASVAPSLQVAMGMAENERRTLIETFVVEQAARVLGFRAGDRPPLNVALTDLGLDSLMAVDLKNRLQTGLGQELSPTIVFDYPTISSIVGMLETMLWAGHGSGADECTSAHEDVIRI